MNNDATPGLFVAGTSTEVGKTYVAAMIARELRSTGKRVGVYKPVTSGCRSEDGQTVADDALQMWEAAGRPATLEQVCPQRFLAPIAPNLAARQEGAQVDSRLLRTGLQFWLDRSEVVVVEGAGGLMSPISDEDYCVDLAADLELPLLIVADNQLGVINQTLQTLITAENKAPGLAVAGVILNEPLSRLDDASLETNAEQLRQRMSVPLLSTVRFGSASFDAEVDWMALAEGRPQ